MEQIELSVHEKAAKTFIMKLVEECPSSSIASATTFRDEDFRLPDWFDTKLFERLQNSSIVLKKFQDDFSIRRGQKYFIENKLGMLFSNMFGLLSLVSEPEGAKFLDRTGKSSTKQTAKKRYTSTLLHMLSWYEEELKPGSKSWESLKRVRKMHTCASNSSSMKGLGVIDHVSMTLTVFGFMGYALVRPHLLGIRHDNLDDRKAFVHFWAVIGSMLGIEDSNNMCLHSIEVVETICRIFIRYVFVPLLQLETPVFEKLGEAIAKALRSYMPLTTFKSRLFLARRLAGVPGYQYDVDMSKEFFIHQIFSAAELESFKTAFRETPAHLYRQNFIFHDEILLLEIERNAKTNCAEGDKADSGQNFQTLMDVLDLTHSSQLKVTKVDEKNLGSYLNHNCFQKLSRADQLIVQTEASLVKMMRKNYFRSFASLVTNASLKNIERQASSI